MKIFHFTTTLPLILSVATLFETSQAAKSIQLQQTIALLNKPSNQKCFEFIDTFEINNFHQNPLKIFDSSVTFCFDNNYPKMSYDLKLIECFIAMHNFLTFEVTISKDQIQEQTKLEYISVICNDLERSLQWRDDLVDRMSRDMGQAYQYCNKTLTYNTNDQVNNWWWDRKTVSSSGMNTCTILVDQIKEDQDYGIITNAGIDLALDSFFTQLQSNIQYLCEFDSRSFDVFARQCAYKIQDSDLLSLINDQQIESICQGLAQQVASCESASWLLIKKYYEAALKMELEDYGYLMINGYLDQALQNLENTIDSHIIPRQASDDAANSVTTPDGVQIPASVSPVDTPPAQQPQTTQNAQINEQVEDYNDYDEEDDDNFTSVPLDIPIR